MDRWSAVTPKNFVAALFHCCRLQRARLILDQFQRMLSQCCPTQTQKQVQIGWKKWQISQYIHKLTSDIKSDSFIKLTRTAFPFTGRNSFAFGFNVECFTCLQKRPEQAQYDKVWVTDLWVLRFIWQKVIPFNTQLQRLRGKQKSYMLTLQPCVRLTPADPFWTIYCTYYNVPSTYFYFLIFVVALEPTILAY